MYQERLTAFIDILGFGSLVEASASDPALQKSISDALSSVSPQSMIGKDYLHVNEDGIPASELAEARRMASLFVQAVRAESPVVVSYFSDSVVLSAASDQPLGTQMVLDLIGKLTIRLWIDYGMTMRGGITVGKLYHEDGGKIFGPAMNCAYRLEHEMAKFPRVIMDASASHLFANQATFEPLRSLLHQGDDFAYMSLGTCLKYSVDHSAWCLGNETYRQIYRRTMNEAAGKIEAVIKDPTKAKAAAKYEWLRDEVAARKGETRRLADEGH